MTLCVLLESLNWFDVSYGVICRSSCTSRLSPLYSNQQTSVVLDRRSATGQDPTSALQAAPVGCGSLLDQSKSKRLDFAPPGTGI